MPSTSGTNRPARTLLEQLIHERNQTLEEFAAYAETFAQEHGEPGTLSAGHLQRLVAGRRYDGRPLGRLRPATTRLLERIFGATVDDLLSSPMPQHEQSSTIELNERLSTSNRVDSKIIEMLYKQLSAIRYLDRQLGAAIAHEEVRVKIDQVRTLLSHSLSQGVYTQLAAILSELSMLAGWQALDLCEATQSWSFYQQAKSAAKESNSKAFEAHATAQLAFVLIDCGKPFEAVNVVAQARRDAARHSSPLLRSWLAAAHGEALAANEEGAASLRAFDAADIELPVDITTVSEGPYVVLDQIHLNRWRGHALSRIGSIDAIEVLRESLDRLNPSFTRAEAALRVDLATALYKMGERQGAIIHSKQALHLAQIVGSDRQRRRILSMCNFNKR